MRDDIAKLICERPRTGAHGGLSKQYRREVAWGRLVQEGREEDSPLREQTRRKWGWDRKEFSDYLAPIHGFLRKSVGRPWDDVWSELAAHLSEASTTQRHVLGHVREDVVINAVEQDDGSITEPNGRKIYSYRSGSYYVDPRDGVLRAVKHEPRSRSTWTPRIPAVRFHRIKGLWFEVEFSRPKAVGRCWEVNGHVFSTQEKLEEWLSANYDFYRRYAHETDRLENVVDVLLEREAKFEFNRKSGAHWLDNGDLYCSAKRQAGKKAIRQFGLRSVVDDHAGPVVRLAM